VRLDFSDSGRAGRIEVDVRANHDPAAIGTDDDHRGFPVCTATVETEAVGYHAMFGWVQLVRSTDAATDEFEDDPFFLFTGADHPYCFFGHKPTLFDAPGRDHRRDLTWQAHAFLAVTPFETADLVVPLQGFSWGFHRTDGVITLDEPAPLDPTAWRDHLPYLQTTFPRWRFTSTAWRS
jgi:hypothetical protein